MIRLSPAMITLATIGLFLFPAGVTTADDEGPTGYFCVVASGNVHCGLSKIVPRDADGNYLTHIARFYENGAYNAENALNGAHFDLYGDSCQGAFDLPPEWDNRISSIQVQNCAILIYDDVGSTGPRQSCTTTIQRCEHLAAKMFDDITSSVRLA